MTDIKPTWSFMQKVCFRFFFSFFALYMLSAFTSRLFRVFVPWFAEHLLKLEKPITIFTNGSGDTTYDYVAVLVYLLLALMATLVWSVIDRNRQHYQHLNYWLGAFLRYYLAMFMFTYGFIKIFHLQMPSPSFTKLIQEFGDKSPMGLAWSYVGYSKGFSFFTGLAEVLAGFFLLFRKTATLGALLTAMVTLNILVINLCFDVPVKLFSAVLLSMSVFLLIVDAKRLLHFFIWNKPTASAWWPAPFKRKWMRVLRLALKVLIIGYFFFAGISGGMRGQKAYGDKRTKPPLYGLYEVELFLRNNDTIPPLRTDGTRWKNLIIEWEKNAAIKMTNDSLRYYGCTIDTLHNHIVLTNRGDSTDRGAFTYQRTNTSLILQGKMEQDSIYMRLKERAVNSFRLMNRGFRWINEYPYNR